MEDLILPETLLSNIGSEKKEFIVKATRANPSFRPINTIVLIGLYC